MAIEAISRYCVPEKDVPHRSAIHQLHPPAASQAEEEIDYYEVLQLSQKADMETIHRVYRIMAARFHPDNPDSGIPERFCSCRKHTAYSAIPPAAPLRPAPGRRMPRPLPLFQARAFVDEKEGEINRRLGVLCLLYAQRRRVPDHPAIALMSLEAMMSIPREYLEFTLWYLKQKHYVQMDDGADFSLTAAGVDFVEEHTSAQDILLRLLASGGMTETVTPPPPAGFPASHVQ